jgi:aryl-phospho-beta-D-glucosidase BglC (GH1 family)
MASKSISVALSSTAFTGSKTFKVTLSAPTGGAALGTPMMATVSVNGATSGGGGTSQPTAGMSLKIQSGHFLDASGNVVQLRGVNVSGLESVPLQGWSPGNPWGSQTGTATPDWNLIKTWGVNAVRLPLNQASWLGYQCLKTASAATTTNPDPGANYQATVLQSVADANAAGLYVILDLHWTGPDYNGTPICPTAQQPMADSDHSPAFWTSLATAFKSNPAVIFELFNEPFLGESARGDKTAAGSDIAYGTGIETAFLLSGTVNYTWTITGMQQMLDAVRATGAKNPVLVGSDSWSQQLVDFLAYPVTDSAGQLGAAWHPYPITMSGSSTPQARCVGLPACSALQLQAAKDIITAGYPVVITEFGDAISSSSTPNTNSPWSQILLPWADTNGVSYLGWTWDTWSGFTSNVLIIDAAGDPTNGYGAYVKQHLQCRAANNGSASCP